MAKFVFAPIAFMVAMLCFIPLSYAQTTNDNTTLADVKKETGDLLETIKGYTYEQRDETINVTKQSIDKLDKRIDNLEARIRDNWEKMDKEAREDARAAMSELRQRRTALAENYGSLKTSSSNAWEDMKKGFSDAFQEVDNAWEKAKNEFKADGK